MSLTKYFFEKKFFTVIHCFTKRAGIRFHLEKKQMKEMLWRRLGMAACSACLADGFEWGGVAAELSFTSFHISKGRSSLSSESLPILLTSKRSKIFSSCLTLPGSSKDARVSIKSCFTEVGLLGRTVLYLFRKLSINGRKSFFLSGGEGYIGLIRSIGGTDQPETRSDPPFSPDPDGSRQ